MSKFFDFVIRWGEGMYNANRDQINKMTAGYRSSTMERSEVDHTVESNLR